MEWETKSEMRRRLLVKAVGFVLAASAMSAWMIFHH
jgi:hypothetical protein